MHVKKRKIKKTRGKEGNIYKVCSIEPRDKMPTYSLVQWESQSAVVRLICFDGLCVFLLIQNNFKHKRKPVVKKSLNWLVAFTLKKEFEPLLCVLVCKRKRKQVLILLHAWMDKKLENKQGKLSSAIPNVIMHGLQPKV